MSTKGADQVIVNDNAYTNNAGGTMASHSLLSDSGAYTPPTDGKAATSTASSGSSWHTGEGFLNLITGEVFSSNKTPAQLRTELQGSSTATTALNNAREDFVSGNNDVGVQDLKTAKTAMDADPNMSRQVLHLDFDLGLTEASKYVPFFGASMQEHYGLEAAGLVDSVSKVGQEVATGLSRRSTNT